MESNEKLIHDFYQSFQRKDYQGMQDCYHEQAQFSDEAFVDLRGNEPGLMWEMLIKSSSDLELVYADVQANEQEGTARWVATYTFSRTGRTVRNEITASFRFADNKIIHHVDQFDFYKWARGVFGLTGVLIGWTPFFRRKIQSGAREQLMRYKQTRA